MWNVCIILEKHMKNKKSFTKELIEEYGKATYEDRVRNCCTYDSCAWSSVYVAEACGLIEKKDEDEFHKALVKYAKDLCSQKFPSGGRGKFDKELVQKYGQMVFSYAKTNKVTVEKSAIFYTFTARLAGEVCVEDGDKFRNAIIKAAKKIL
jgi:hypothetical protein